MSKTKRHAHREALVATTAADPKPVAAQRVDGPHVVSRTAEHADDVGRTAEHADDVPLATGAALAAAEVLPLASPEPAVVLPEATLFVEFESAPDELLQAQAEQLAAILRERQRELDHREGQLNAALARFEHDARKARLLSDERQRELVERQAALDAQAADLEDRAGRLLAAERFVEAARCDGEGQQARAAAALAEREAELTFLGERLALREAASAEQAADLRLERARLECESRRERQQLDARRAAAVQFVQLLLDAQDRRRAAIEGEFQQVDAQRREARAELSAREAALQRSVGELHARQQRLREDEAAHAQERADLEQERRELEAWHAGVLARLEQDARDEAARRRQADDESATRRQTLERRAEHLDARQIALDGQLEEVRRLHREALEARLAGEELWVQLSAAAPTATLARSLARTRAQLTDQYRLANAELVARRQALEGLSQRLEERCAQAQTERVDVQQWVAGRQEELERHAAELVAHEQELQRRAEELRRQHESWHDERRDLQRQVQQLRGELRAREELTAVN